MTDEADFTPIRRILVPLDSSPESIAALEPAAWIASVMRSKLTALLVEEQELFTLADLPFSREISIMQPQTRNLDPSRLEQEMRARAVTMQKKIARIAARYSVEWSFKVVRGHRDREIATLAEARDLIAMFSDRDARYPGEIMKYAARHRPQDVGSGLLMVGGHAAHSSGPVFTVFDGSQPSQQVLRLAADIARGNAMPLRVLVLNRDAGQQEELKRTLQELLDGGRFSGLRVETGHEAEDALRRLCLRSQGLLVLADSFEGGLVEHLTMPIRCPTIILRTGP